MWDVLDKFSIITGIIGFIPIVVSLCLLLRQERRQRFYLRQVRANPGSRPAVLIVAVGPVKSEIRTQVENWVRQQEWGRELPADSIFECTWDRQMEPDDVVPLLERLRHQRVAIIRQGATAIHLFYAGPVAVAAMIGAELSNGCPVHVYHYNSGEGRYVNWGLLDWADSPAAI